MPREDFDYASCYCEENVYKFIEKAIGSRDVIRSYALVLTNASECTALWYQRSSPAPASQPILWDYHVVSLIINEARDALIYDLDSVLPFPSKAVSYLTKTCKKHSGPYAPYVKILQQYFL